MYIYINIYIYMYDMYILYVYIYIGPPAAAPKTGPQAEFASLRLLSYLEGPRTQIKGPCKGAIGGYIYI